MESTQRIRAILSFVQTAGAGSFAAAARALGISSAAVSKNVAGLESALGVRLMNRTTRTLSLTAEGAAFLKQARIALDALDTAVDTVAAHRLEPTGKVRISTSGAFGRDHVMPALPGLLGRYPALSIEMDFDDRRIDLVQEGYDLGLRGGQILDSALVSRSICRLNMSLWPHRPTSSAAPHRIRPRICSITASSQDDSLEAQYLLGRFARTTAR
jgi:DNA-binding transcriptional LysR family regulator